MLTSYIQAAMRRAKYEILPDDGSFYGEIPGFDGVYSNTLYPGNLPRGIRRGVGRVDIVSDFQKTPITRC